MSWAARQPACRRLKRHWRSSFGTARPRCDHFSMSLGQQCGLVQWEVLRSWVCGRATVAGFRKPQLNSILNLLLLLSPFPISHVQLLEESQRVHVSFTGEFGPHTTTPRQLTSKVCADGGADTPAGVIVICVRVTNVYIGLRAASNCVAAADSDATAGGSRAELRRSTRSNQSVDVHAAANLHLLALGTVFWLPPAHPHPHLPPFLLSPAQFLSKLVNLQGIVTRCTLVRPKIVKSVHWCPVTGQFQSREYRDVTSNTGAPTTTAYPTK